MIRIAVVGDIGSGKSYVAKLFGHPVFNADLEVAKIYKNNRKCFLNLKKKIPKFIKSYPINKKEISKAILAKNDNIQKIVKIIHPEIRKKLLKFLNKNKNKKIVILDIPLLFENKINKKNDILIFIDAQRKKIYKKLTQRKNFDPKLFKKFKRIQLPLEYKKRKSQFVLKNNFSNKSTKKGVKIILKKILNND